MKTILSLILFACVASAQVPNFFSGAAAPSVGSCSDIAQVGNFYNRTGNPANGFAGLYICMQTGAPSLGQGAYGWVALAQQPATPTTGTISVANGKAAVISNSITLAGTDATTYTFPSVAITVPGTIGTFCGTTSTCAATNISSTMKVVSGQAPLVSGTPSTVVISGFSPAFTSTTSFACSVTDMTTATNNLLKVVNTSASSITITGPNTLTDTIGFVCFGN